MTENLAVFATGERYRERAARLAEHLGVPLLDARDVPGNGKDQCGKASLLMLQYGQEGLQLTDGRLVLKGDFTQLSGRLKKGVLGSELLVKAAKIKGKESPVVMDATAGLGEDSFLLAAAGCHVELYESDPVIAALLRDALERAALVPQLCEAAGRMRLHEEDSIRAMQLTATGIVSGHSCQVSKTARAPGADRDDGQKDGADITMVRQVPDVIYLDPMFPARQKSALVKKKFQLLQQLEQPCGNEEELLQAALDARPHKIVIKRPLKGPFLAGRKPDYTLSGKAIRYDVIVLA